MRILSLITKIIISAAFILGSTVLAENYRLKQKITVFGNEVILPMSAWQVYEYAEYKRTQSDGPLFRSHRQQKNRQFILEQIPINQTFSDWTSLSATLAIYHPDEKHLTAKHFAYSNKMFFKKSCSFYQYMEIPVSTKTSDGIIITLFCEQINHTNDGEIMVKFITTTPNQTTIQAYTEWKGSAFNVLDQKTWPVSWSTITGQIKRYQQVEVYTKE